MRELLYRRPPSSSSINNSFIINNHLEGSINHCLHPSALFQVSFIPQPKSQADPTPFFQSTPTTSVHHAWAYRCLAFAVAGVGGTSIQHGDHPRGCRSSAHFLKFRRSPRFLHRRLQEARHRGFRLRPSQLGARHPSRERDPTNRASKAIAIPYHRQHLRGLETYVQHCRELLGLLRPLRRRGH